MADGGVALEGLRASSFLGYLQGLGLLRVVGRQLDPGARGAWRDGRFVLWSEAVGDDLDALVAFFVERWVPTPVVSPWNGGSGFFPGDTGANAFFAAIDASEDARLASYRATRATAKAVLDELGLAAKPDPKTQKLPLLQRLRARLDDDALEWLDAAVVIDTEPRYAPVLGSGGNDGRFDVSANLAEAIGCVLRLERRPATEAKVRAWLGELLDGRGSDQRALGLGQFRREGSWVSQAGSDGKAFANPWDLPLAVEGTLVLAASATRRQAHDRRVPVAPFSLRPTAAGYGSAATGEAARAELWMPRWTAPSTFAAVRALMREGRTEIDRRPARSGLDAARASAALGVARGIAGFERFTIVERAGQANLALHAGSISVRPRPAAAIIGALEHDGWLDRVRAKAVDGGASAQRAAARALERAVFELSVRGDAEGVARLVVALGATERAFARSAPEHLRTIAPPLAPWLEALDTTHVEVRVALAIAGLGDPREAELPSPRLVLRGTQPWKPYAEAQRPLVPSDADGRARLVALALRRAVDATAAADRRPPELRARFAHQFGPTLELGDIAAIARRAVDLDRVMALVDGLCLLDARGAPPIPRPEGVDGPVAPVLGPLLLAAHGHPDRKRPPHLQPTPPGGLLAQLAAGRAAPALRGVLTRLRAAELIPIATQDDLLAGGPDWPLLAVALLPRPSRRALVRAARECLRDPAAASRGDGEPEPAADASAPITPTERTAHAR